MFNETFITSISTQQHKNLAQLYHLIYHRFSCFHLAHYHFSPTDSALPVQRFALFMLPRNRGWLILPTNQTYPALSNLPWPHQREDLIFEIAIQGQAVNHSLPRIYAEFMSILAFKGSLLFFFTLVRCSVLIYSRVPSLTGWGWGKQWICGACLLSVL